MTKYRFSDPPNTLVVVTNILTSEKDSPQCYNCRCTSNGKNKKNYSIYAESTASAARKAITLYKKDYTG